jgi:hypothetical protein
MSRPATPFKAGQSEIVGDKSFLFYAYGLGTTRGSLGTSIRFFALVWYVVSIVVVPLLGFMAFPLLRRMVGEFKR